MDIAEPDQIAKPPALASLGILEVDAFCAACHYNLHGQVVSLDDRLGIPVCRCPECGRFHPAGAGVTAHSIWLRRLATLLLFVWICLALGFAVAGVFAIAGVDSGSIEAYSDWQQASPSGKPVEDKVVNGATITVEQGTGIVVINPRNIYTLRPFLALYDTEGKPNIAAPMLCGLSIFLGFLAGTLCVTLLWHWPKHRYFWCLSLPWVPASLLMLSYTMADPYEFIRHAIFARIAGQTSLQCIGILLGVLLGRKVSRTLARMLVPPKARQVLAFLWRVDGKSIPAGIASTPT